ncbi:hypothetical protein MTO96_014264 [Rhipicephalus appendiculatus]
MATGGQAVSASSAVSADAARHSVRPPRRAARRCRVPTGAYATRPRPIARSEPGLIADDTRENLILNISTDKLRTATVPVIMLHSHLEGHLRHTTIWELAQAKNIDLGYSSLQDIIMKTQPERGSTLQNYLKEMPNFLRVVALLPKPPLVKKKMFRGKCFLETVIGVALTPQRHVPGWPHVQGRPRRTGAGRLRGRRGPGEPGRAVQRDATLPPPHGQPAYASEAE